MLSSLTSLLDKKIFHLWRELFIIRRWTNWRRSL